METITLNLLPRAKRVERDGKSYLVAPFTGIVSGVLEGSQGSLYYPPEEIARNADEWNGLPLTVYHPYDEHGNNVSATYKGVLDRQGVGHIEAIRGDKGKLKGEAWFNEERIQKVSPATFQFLKSGKPIEVSTGLFTENIPAPVGSADAKGRAYAFIAKNYKPDHLAILPDQRGACSVKDGCGVLVNANGWYAVGNESSCGTERTSSASMRTGKSKKCSCKVGEKCLCPKGKVEMAANAKPSSGLDMTPEKACKIIKDGTVHGKPLTEKQRGMFGAKCGQRVKNMAWTMVVNAFCPTGMGGGVDPHCSLGGEKGKGKFGKFKKKVGKVSVESDEDKGTLKLKGDKGTTESLGVDDLPGMGLKHLGEESRYEFRRATRAHNDWIPVATIGV